MGRLIVQDSYGPWPLTGWSAGRSAIGARAPMSSSNCEISAASGVNTVRTWSPVTTRKGFLLDTKTQVRQAPRRWILWIPTRALPTHDEVPVPHRHSCARWLPVRRGKEYHDWSETRYES